MRSYSHAKLFGEPVLQIIETRNVNNVQARVFELIVPLKLEPSSDAGGQDMNLSEINLSDIDLREAGDWPLAGKSVLVVWSSPPCWVAGYYFFTSDQLDELDRVTREEQQLRQEFIEKQRVRLIWNRFGRSSSRWKQIWRSCCGSCRRGRKCPILLEDVSNTGKKNGLEFELFKPEAEQPRDFYAAKPITIKARGRIISSARS
jgi:type IV pilus assembly protein PilO